MDSTRTGAAKLGADRDGLERLLASLYARIHCLSLRMLLSPEDAEDATQEIALKIARGLGGFRGESSLETWALAIASKHLLTARSRRIPGLSFEAYEAEVGAHADARGAGLSEGERAVLEEELKISCTLGMLQCLDKLDRLTYVLHCFFGLSSEEGGRVAGLSAEAYRQRLSRTRKRMAEFMGEVCGLAGGPCSCAARLDYALAKGRVSREPRYANPAPSAAEIGRFVESMEGLDAAGAAFRSQRPLAPGDAADWAARVVGERARELGLAELADR